MQRDGYLKSAWQELEYYQPKNIATLPANCDVLIVGAGITGLTTALLLQAAGKRCIVAEAHNIGFGTTGGTTAHLNTMLDTPYKQIVKDFSEDEARLVAKGATEAIKLVEQLSQKYGIDCDFAWKTAYLYAEKDEELKQLDDIYQGIRDMGLPADTADTNQLPIPFIKAYKFDGQARVHPMKYINGLAKAFEEAGGTILEHCLVESVDTTNGILAHTSHGDISATNLIYATHTVPGITVFTFRCAPYRSYAMAFTTKADQYPADLVYDVQDPYHYFRTHEINGQKYIIAGGCDHKTGHNENTDYSFTELEAYLRKYFDIDQVAYKWSSQYYESDDGLPYIGLMPEHEHLYVATGFGGNGILLGSLSGKIISEMILTGNSEYEEVFNPSRIKMIAGFSNFVRENADVVSMFIGKRLNYQRITEMAELAHGEAMVVKWEGEPLALYKDEKGRIHALDPVCPHAKCIVSWNSAEKSWDCPCHGGRYSCNGELLTGPARKGLKVIDWDHL